jgi:hypothetical protein
MLILIMSYKTIKLTAKLWLIRKLANHFLLAMLLHILIFLRILLLHTNYLYTLVSLFILYYNIFPLLICLLIGIDKTYQTLQGLYFGISRANVKWTIDRCKHCTQNKAQQNIAGVTPIISHCPSERMVLDLMDFRVSYLSFLIYFS